MFTNSCGGGIIEASCPRPHPGQFVSPRRFIFHPFSFRSEGRFIRRLHAGKGVAVSATRHLLLGALLLGFCLFVTGGVREQLRRGHAGRFTSHRETVVVVPVTAKALLVPAPPWLTHPPGWAVC